MTDISAPYQPINGFFYYCNQSDYKINTIINNKSCTFMHGCVLLLHTTTFSWPFGLKFIQSCCIRKNTCIIHLLGFCVCLMFSHFVGLFMHYLLIRQYRFYLYKRMLWPQKRTKLIDQFKLF